MGMPWNISKGTILEKLDQVLNDPDEREKSIQDSFHAALIKDSQSLLDILKAKKILYGNWHVSHVEEHWFNPQGWWKDDEDPQGPRYVQPLDTLIREGLIKALDLAIYDPDSGTRRERSLPIHCYWICAAHHHFEIDICVSPQQVTFILLSPNVPKEGRHGKANRCLKDKEPIWVLQRMSQADADAAFKRSEGAVTKASICATEGETRIVIEQLRNFPANLRKGILPPSDASPHDH